MASLLDDLFGAPEEEEAAQEALYRGQDEILRSKPLVLGDVEFERGRYVGDPSMQGYEAETIDEMPDLMAQGYEADLVGPSAMEGVGTDPRLRNAQLAALAKLEEIGNSGGLTAQDRSRLAKIESDTNAADRGKREAILQNARARGMGGSSQELLASLQGAQASTDMQNSANLNVEAMAEQRALDALSQAGQLGGQIRGQDFGEGAQRADASDAIARFNAANTTQARQFGAGAANDMGRFNAGQRMDARQFNAGARTQAKQFGADARNSASMWGAQARQGVSNANVDISNRQTMQNKITNPTTMWEADRGQAKDRADVYGKEAEYWGEKAGRKAKEKAGMWEAGMKGAAAVAMMMSDERKKEAKKPFKVDDLEEFLSAVKPATFRYKDSSEPGALPGKRVGFMAQDVKDTELGKSLVSERDDGTLQYDPENLQGIILASLKMLEEKQKEKA
jgi:hypothetical protein